MARAWDYREMTSQDNYVDEEENISLTVNSAVHRDFQKGKIEKYDFRICYLKEGRRLFCFPSEIFTLLEYCVCFGGSHTNRDIWVGFLEDTNQNGENIKDNIAQ